MNIEQKILKAVLLLRKRGNKSQSKEEQIEEVKAWMRDDAFSESELDEWIEELGKAIDGGEDENAEYDYWADDDFESRLEFEKSYGPLNPWDAPGMKVSDFI